MASAGNKDFAGKSGEANLKGTDECADKTKSKAGLAKEAHGASGRRTLRVFAAKSSRGTDELHKTALESGFAILHPVGDLRGNHRL